MPANELNAATAAIMAASEPKRKTLDVSTGWRGRLIATAEGKPRALLANVIAALRYAPEWESVLGFNTFSLAAAMRKRAPWGGEAEANWTDNEDRLATDWMHHHGILVGVEVTGQAVQTVAREHSFHPVREYLGALEWDGVRRIQQWLNVYLGVEQSAYVAAVGSRWLISAVARIYQPGAKTDCCLIVEGPQGAGKSTALNILGGDWFADEIAELGSKDAAMQTMGVWIIEIAELDSMSRAEVGRIKAFMSRSVDRFRPPYGRCVVGAPRQCIFGGSVNHSTYLRDETGGRRFWPVTCGTIHTDELARDRDQLFAEAVVSYWRGATWWLDSPELTEASNQEQAARYEGDVWDGLITDWISDRIAGGFDSVSVPEILNVCIEKPKDQWTQADMNRIARCLRAKDWERYRDRKRGQEWRYRPKCSQSGFDAPSMSVEVGTPQDVEF